MSLKIKTYPGLIKIRKNGNSKVLSVPAKFQPKGNLEYRVQINQHHQLIYTPVTKRSTNLFNTPKWKHFNRRKYLKHVGIGTDTNLVGKEKYDK